MQNRERNASVAWLLACLFCLQLKKSAEDEEEEDSLMKFCAFCAISRKKIRNEKAKHKWINFQLLCNKKHEKKAEKLFSR